MPLTPGLAATVEIKTGERRIIGFLLPPLARRVKEGGERTVNPESMIMTKNATWPRPYLISLVPTKPSKVFLDLPSTQNFVEEIAGFGPVEIKLGGLPWELKREYLQSIRDFLRLPLHGFVSIDDESNLDFIQQEAICLVSQKFRSVAEPYLKDTEFLPLELEFTPKGARAIGGGAVRGDYYWMNNWLRQDVANRQASVLSIMPADEKDAFNSKNEPLFSAWELLSLNALSEEANLYGVSGLYGGSRFVSPHLHMALKQADVNVAYRAIVLDRQDPATLNAAQNEFNSFLNQ